MADGYDFELGAHVPYVPSTKIFAKIFEYEIPGGSDFEGLEYTSSVDIPNSGLNVEVGFKDYGNKSYEDQWFVNLTFNFSSINKNTNFNKNLKKKIVKSKNNKNQTKQIKQQQRCNIDIAHQSKLALYSF